MPHNHHTDDDSLLEVTELGSPVAVMATIGNWVDPYSPPPITTHELEKGRRVRVVRDDLSGIGTKARAGAAVLDSPRFRDATTLVYVQPRAGWAGLSLAKLAKDRGLRLILFCPAAAEPSHYQRLCWDRGADIRAVRVPAMPVLNTYARRFAEEHGYAFLPLGLKIPEATAGIARVASSLPLRKVEQVWCAVSTGVLLRGLQLAWPKVEFIGVAVARNIHEGEKGKASLRSHPLPFLREAPYDEQPPYPSASAYDAKVWRYVVEEAKNGAVIWNVAGDPPAPSKESAKLDIQRDWHDYSDLRRR